MANDIPTQGELYSLYRNEVESRAPGLTDFEEGSNLDALGGGFSVGGQEIVKFITDNFARTFFNTANGPAITGGPDDLENLAVDHFGANFARPPASRALATVTFTRLVDNGPVVISAGTIVKTDKDSNGVEYRFQTVLDFTMTGLGANASVEAIEPGSDSNVAANTIVNIETALTDPAITVNNILGAVGGSPIPDDPEYREFIRRNVETIRGATSSAIEASALNVAGVTTATAIESVVDVIQYDIATALPVPGAIPFKIPRGILYVADANGTASQALIDSVTEAISTIRACGVVKEVIGAAPLQVAWSASYTLNPDGPNFAEFNSNSTRVRESMEQYIRDLPIGQFFDRGLSRQAILAIWGPNGTNDLTDFVTNSPTGNVAAAPTEKLIPGNVEIV